MSSHVILMRVRVFATQKKQVKVSCETYFQLSSEITFHWKWQNLFTL